MDSSRSSTNPRYYNPSEYSPTSSPELKSSPTSSPTSAYLASSGSLNAKPAELLILQQSASQRHGRSRARLAQGYQDLKYAKRDLESSAYTSEPEKDGEEGDDEEVEDEYIIEDITNHWVDEETGELHFEVQWKGYGRKQDPTLEPEDNLSMIPEMLNKYLASIGGKEQILSLWQEEKAKAAQKKGNITGRIPVHTCDTCRPAKTFTRAKHLRRHQLSHQKPTYICTFGYCEKAFYRRDLLDRHLRRHETQGSGPYKLLDASSRASSPRYSSDSDSTYSTRSDEPRNPLDKFAETFKKMEGKAWKSSAKISGISSTISKDNTSGECARQAKLFAEFGKRRSCAFASSFAQHYEGADE